MIRLTVEDFDGRLGSKNKRRIDALIRRADFLRARVSADSRELSFDRHELSALEWAIDQIHRAIQLKAWQSFLNLRSASTCQPGDSKP